MGATNYNEEAVHYNGIIRSQNGFVTFCDLKNKAFFDLNDNTVSHYSNVISSLVYVNLVSFLLTFYWVNFALFIYLIKDSKSSTYGQIPRFTGKDKSLNFDHKFFYN